MRDEVWRPVANHEFYEVSNLGRVRRITRAVLRPIKNRGGYLRVHLGPRLSNIHGLVAKAFIGDCPSGYEVNHIDGDPANNSVENLEYVTKSQNCRHAYDVLGRQPPHKGEGTHFSKLKDNDVVQIRRMRKEGHTYEAIATHFNTKPANVWHICQGRTWKHLL